MSCFAYCIFGTLRTAFWYAVFKNFKKHNSQKTKTGFEHTSHSNPLIKRNYKSLKQLDTE